MLSMFLSIGLLASIARADALPCQATFDIQSCSDGSGGRTEVREAVRSFQKICQSSQAHLEVLPKLKTECDKPGKTLPDCTNRWDKENRAFRDLGSRSVNEKKALEKIFLSLLAPHTCDAGEQNKAALHELARKYDVVAAAISQPREEAKAKADQFHAAYVKTLLSTKNTDPAKHYAGTKGEEPRGMPAASSVSSMGSVDLVTAYRLALEFNYPGPKDAAIQVGDVEVKVTTAFAKVLKLEGAGVLDDGRMVNASGKKYVFVRILDAPYGLGSYKRTPLDPFRSIAVDPKTIPLGSTVFIYEARGMPIPPAADGTPLFHDGYFRAIDVGSMINGTHIDIYAGHLLEDYRFLQKYFSGKTIHYFVLK